MLKQNKQNNNNKNINQNRGIGKWVRILSWVVREHLFDSMSCKHIQPSEQNHHSVDVTIKYKDKPKVSTSLSSSSPIYPTDCPAYKYLYAKMVQINAIPPACPMFYTWHCQNLLLACNFKSIGVKTLVFLCLFDCICHMQITTKPQRVSLWGSLVSDSPFYPN